MTRRRIALFAVAGAGLLVLGAVAHPSSPSRHIAPHHQLAGFERAQLTTIAAQFTAAIGGHVDYGSFCTLAVPQLARQIAAADVGRHRYTVRVVTVTVNDSSPPTGFVTADWVPADGSSSPVRVASTLTFVRTADGWRVATVRS